MKWVRKKIAKLGGDPGNLTLFVESVGGCIRAHHDDCPYSARLVPGGPHRIGYPAQPARTAAQIFESAPNLLRAKPWALPLRGKPASRVRMHATEVRFVFDTVAARYGKDLATADEATANAALSYWVAVSNSACEGELMNFTNSGPVAEHNSRKAPLDLTEAAVQSK